MLKKIFANPGKKICSYVLIFVLASTLLFTIASADTSTAAATTTTTYQQDLKAAIALDMSNLDSTELQAVKFRTSLAKGTRKTFTGGKLTDSDNVVFAAARAEAVQLQNVSDTVFKTTFNTFLTKYATTKGGRAYLAEFIPGIEMQEPNTLHNISYQLITHRNEFAYTISDGYTLNQIQKIELNATKTSEDELAVIANTDPVRPKILPAPRGGWVNDPYIYYDPNNLLHIFFQQNPYASNWNDIMWGHLVMKGGKVDHRNVALEPRPEEGYYYCFSGSILANKIPHPMDSTKQVNAAFFTPSGIGINGFVSFYEAPPTVMAVTSDSNLNNWEATRYTVTDANTYKNKVDTINGGIVENRYDMRDPIVFKRDGKYFMLVAGSTAPGRVGQGVIAILKPSDPNNLSKPWVYMGDAFRHPQATIASGGPGILETPNIQRVGNKDIIFFGAQRRPSEGNLYGFNNNQGNQYFVGSFDSNTGKFTADSNTPSYFEYGRSVYAINSAQKPGNDTDPKVTFEAYIKGFDELPYWKEVADRGWNWALTFPNTMKLVDGKPYIVPDEMLASIRGTAWYTDGSTTVHPSASVLTSIKERSLDIRTKITLNTGATSATIAVLAKNDKSGGIPITFDGFNVTVLDEKTPLFTTKTSSLDLEAIVDRSVVIVYANGKVLTKAVTPTKETTTSYADNVVLSSVGASASFTNLNVNTLKNY